MDSVKGVIYITGLNKNVTDDRTEWKKEDFHIVPTDADDDDYSRGQKSLTLVATISVAQTLSRR